MDSPYTMIMMFAVLGVAFYFLMIRPQKKRQQEQARMMGALEPGARVLTSTGIFATIVEMGDRQVVLETSPGSRLTVVRQALAKVVTAEDEDPFSSAGASTAAEAPEDPVETELPDSLDPIDPDRTAALDPSDPRTQDLGGKQEYETPTFDPRPEDSSAEDPDAGLNDPADRESDPEDTSPNTKDQ